MARWPQRVETGHVPHRHPRGLAGNNKGAIALAVALLRRDGEDNDGVGVRTVADPGLPPGDAEAARGWFGAGCQVFRVRADLRLGNPNRERPARPRGPLSIGAERQKVAENKLPAAPNARKPQQARALHDAGLQPSDGSVVRNRIKQPGFPHALGRVARWIRIAGKPC